MGGVGQLVGYKAFYAMLFGAACIDRIAHAVGIDPLHDGIGKVEEKGIDIEED